MILLQAASINIHHGNAIAHVVLSPHEDRSVKVFARGNHIWSGIHPEWNPWKLAAMDVDHDGNEEFLVGLHMLTRHAPRLLHTIYVYGFDGKTVYPKWRGSTMGRDFTDFVVTHSPHGDELLTLDLTAEGSVILANHEWNGFGFTKTWERGSWKKAFLTSEGKFVAVHTQGTSIRYDSDGNRR